MSACLRLVVALLTAAGAASRAATQEPHPDAVPPHFDARQHTPEYVGPLDQRVDAAALTEIRLGYFGPAAPQHPLYGRMWQAAERAIDEANQRGGFAGKPFRLVSAWSENPWGSGVKQITQLVYQDHVWAIIGGVDAMTTHLAEQVVVKARLALVSPVSTDKTVNLTNVPWMFSLSPNDRALSDVLVADMVRRGRERRLALITTNDHDAFLLTRELRQALANRQMVVNQQFEYQPQSQAVEPLVRECLAGQPDDVLLVANAQDSLQLVRAVRQAGFTGCIFGGPALGRDVFVQQIGDAAGMLVFPRIDEPAAPAQASITSSTASSDLEGDYAALQAYDAVNIAIAAIEKAGLSRVEIARAIRQLTPIAGRSGRIEWSAPGGNARRPTLATLVDGHLASWPN
jgi:branched-chain amino acid transport system substrate-binding protein